MCWSANTPITSALPRGAALCRQGVNLDRPTLADWVGKAAFLLRRIHKKLFERPKVSDKLSADATTAPVLDRGRCRTKTVQLFAYARDDAPSGGVDPPGVAYLYTPDRRAEEPLRHLWNFVGIQQFDGYAGYRRGLLLVAASTNWRSPMDALAKIRTLARLCQQSLDALPN
ncbi:IS66 family transposase [Aurantimonas coralicida]|nr:IS66 family transposase [Aurantimonas coralicida]